MLSPLNTIVVLAAVVLGVVLFVFMGERPRGHQWKPFHHGHLRMWVRCLVLPLLFLMGAAFIFGVRWPSEASLWMGVRALLWCAIVFVAGRALFRCPVCRRSVVMKYSGSPSILHCAHCGSEI
jgi:Na+/H+-dicarboxylate symporter